MILPTLTTAQQARDLRDKVRAEIKKSWELSKYLEEAEFSRCIMKVVRLSKLEITMPFRIQCKHQYINFVASSFLKYPTLIESCVIDDNTLIVQPSYLSDDKLYKHLFDQSYIDCFIRLSCINDNPFEARIGITGFSEADKNMLEELMTSKEYGYTIFKSPAEWLFDYTEREND